MLFQIDSVGVDLTKFFPISETKKWELRAQFGYKENDFILLYIAEFIPRKNHNFLLDQIKKIKLCIPNIRIVFAGKGKLFERYKKKAKIAAPAITIDFLGYRNDIDKLCQIADIYITPSKQEGLPISILEAMACGLPVVCSKIRGHIDVVMNQRNGFLFDLRKPHEMREAVNTLFNQQATRKQISKNNVIDVRKYSIESTVQKMADIYQKYMYSRLE